MKIIKFSAIALLPLSLSGCLVGSAINAVGETAETAVELTGATVKATGSVIGGTVDAVIPGDQSQSDKSDD